MKIPTGFKEQEIDIQTTAGILRVLALVKGPFALHAKSVGLPIEADLCSVTHMPTGLSLSGIGMVFETVSQAAKAVREIEKLDSWDFTVNEKSAEDRQALGIKVREIALALGGVDLGSGPRPSGMDNSKRLNGYERPA